MYSSKSQRHRSKQMNRKTPARRWLAFLLTICMLIPIMSPFIATAEDEVQLQQADQDLSTIQPAQSEIELDTELAPIVGTKLLKSELLSNDNLPFSMSLADAQKNGFIGRVKAAESNLHSIVFENDKGGLTLYYYNEPVKYIDELGQVRDKSDKLYAYKDGSFGTISSDIKTDFPKKTDRRHYYAERWLAASYGTYRCYKYPRNDFGRSDGNHLYAQ